MSVFLCLKGLASRLSLCRRLQVQGHSLETELCKVFKTIHYGAYKHSPYIDSSLQWL